MNATQQVQSVVIDSRVVSDLAQFKREAEVIVANRLTDEIGDIETRVFTRDLIGAD